MRLFKRNADGTKGASASPWIAATVTTNEEINSNYNQSRNPVASELMALGHSYVSICASRNAENVAACRLRLYRPTERGRGSRSGRKVAREQERFLRGDSWAMPSTKALEYARDSQEFEEVVDHPALQLLRKPNPTQSGNAFRSLRQTFHELVGNSYVYIVTKGSEPTEMYLLYPQWTRVLVDDKRFVYGFTYGRETSRVVQFNTREVWHDKHADNPRDPLYGWSPAQHVVPQIQLYSAITQYENTLFMNNARPDHLIHVEGAVTEKEAESFRSKVESMYRGVWNAGKFILSRGNNKITVTPLQWQPKDLGNIEIQRDQIKAILAAYGVPESEVFVNTSNLGSANTGSTQYQRQTVLPRANREADFWTENLLPAFGLEGYWFAPDNPVPKDEAAEATRLATYVGSDILTINEARAELRYPPIEDGDQLRSDRQAAAMAAATPDPADPAGNPDQPDPGEPSDGERAGVLVVTKTQPCACGACADKGADKPAISQRSLWFNGEKATMPGSAGLEPVPTPLYTQWLGALDSQRDEILRSMDDKPFGLRSSGRVQGKALSRDDVFRILAAWGVTDVQEYADRYFRATWSTVEEEQRRAAQAKMEEAARVFPDLAGTPNFGLDNSRALDWFAKARQNYSARVLGVSERTSMMILDALEEGFADGESIGQLKARVRSVFDAETDVGQRAAAVRAERIARTESANAQIEGTIAGYMGAGVSRKRWMLSEVPCEFCKAAARMFPDGVEVGKEFFPLGSRLQGSDGGILAVDFEGIVGPPLHPNCRCALVPVLD